jgi:hypothetical protein
MEKKRLKKYPRLPQAVCAAYRRGLCDGLFALENSCF